MRILPTQKEIDDAASLLVDTYQISPQMLGSLIGKEHRSQLNDLLKVFGVNRLNSERIARLLIQKLGTALFSGSKVEIRKLRKRIIDRLSKNQIDHLHEKYKPKSNIKNKTGRVGELANMKWQPDGPWPHAFVKETNFPKIFAGVRDKTYHDSLEIVDPFSRPPDLKEFQKKLKDDLLSVMAKEMDKTRCILSLPTGGGKTRVAMEAFVDWMQPRFANGEYLLWIAQSEELCEQAIACLSEMWSSREFLYPLRIYRYFGGRHLDETVFQGGAVIASIHQLYARIRSADTALITFLSNTGVMIIDEAHRAVTKMYDRLIGRAKDLRGEDLFPICGLTATPGRSGISKVEGTQKLVGRFEAHLLQPNLDSKYKDDPLKYFREKGYLATPIGETSNGFSYVLSDQDMKNLNNDKEPANLLKTMATDKKRNQKIIGRLLKLDNDKPTLVYTCSVNHAYLLSMLMKELGRTSCAISSETSMTLRRGFIERYKKKEIQFIFNYGVLTTGFDAPLTEVIVLCRPIWSHVLYEQIIGRGLRGPEFGGTKDCLIIDFEDSLSYHGKPQSYVRFKNFWS